MATYSDYQQAKLDSIEPSRLTPQSYPPVSFEEWSSTEYWANEVVNALVDGDGVDRDELLQIEGIMDQIVELMEDGEGTGYVCRQILARYPYLIA